jgi:hypothetical protein
MSFTHHLLPIYTNDQSNYWKQMHEKMHHYHDQLCKFIWKEQNIFRV